MVYLPTNWIACLVLRGHPNCRLWIPSISTSYVVVLQDCRLFHYAYTYLTFRIPNPLAAGSNTEEWVESSTWHRTSALFAPILRLPHFTGRYNRPPCIQAITTAAGALQHYCFTHFPRSARTPSTVSHLLFSSWSALNSTAIPSATGTHYCFA